MAAEKLTKVRTQFVEGVNGSVIKDILDELLHVKVLNDAEVEDVNEGQSRTKDKARSLIDMVRKKGNNASQKFIVCLLSKDAELCHKLQLDADSGAPLPFSSTQVPSPTPPGAPLPFSSTQVPSPSPPGPQSSLPDQWLVPCPLEDYKRILKTEADQIYPILDKGIRKRIALIINNIEFKELPKRNGAEVDEAGMKKLLDGLGYDMELHNNLNSQKMKETLEKFAKREEHRQADSTFIVIMSHGIRGAICGVECKEDKADTLPVDTIFDIFNTKNCTALKEKPKVIIIQACRGERTGHVWVSDSITPSVPEPDMPPDFEDDALTKAHVERDFICFCSSTPDNVSWRSPKNGSVFIQRLIEKVRNQAYAHHIEELFRMVQLSFSDFVAQMPTKERTTLLKKFYLFPGH